VTLKNICVHRGERSIFIAVHLSLKIGYQKGKTGKYPDYLITNHESSFANHVFINVHNLRPRRRRKLFERRVILDPLKHCSAKRRPSRRATSSAQAILSEQPSGMRRSN
jgi:hypothetical protein